MTYEFLTQSRTHRARVDGHIILIQEEYEDEFHWIVEKEVKTDTSYRCVLVAEGRRRGLARAKRQAEEHLPCEQTSTSNLLS